jgi:hypothetical protein
MLEALVMDGLKLLAFSGFSFVVWALLVCVNMFVPWLRPSEDDFSDKAMYAMAFWVTYCFALPFTGVLTWWYRRKVRQILREEGIGW